MRISLNQILRLAEIVAPAIPAGVNIARVLVDAVRGGQVIVTRPVEVEMTADEFESRFAAYEAARASTSQHAAERIEDRHREG